MMPNVDPALFGLQDKTPAELDQRLSAILKEINGFPMSHDDPNVPTSLLHELALISGMLRRRTAGPSKAPKRGPAAPVGTAADLANLLRARS